MDDDAPPTDAELVAELNDLLQLDHDAVAACTLAVQGLGTPERLRRGG